MLVIATRQMWCFGLVTRRKIHFSRRSLFSEVNHAKKPDECGPRAVFAIVSFLSFFPNFQTMNGES